MIESMGLVFIIIALMSIFLVIGSIVYMALKKAPIIQKVGGLIANKLLFNFFIRTFIAGYLVFGLSALFNYKALNFDGTGNAISSCLAIIQSVVCIVSPVGMFFLVIKYKS
jgi:hypothetical protein